MTKRNLELSSIALGGTCEPFYKKWKLINHDNYNNSIFSDSHQPTSIRISSLLNSPLHEDGNYNAVVQLPDEILFRIFWMLNDAPMLGRVSAVSQQWHQVSKDNRLWARLYIKYFPIRRYSLLIASTCPALSLDNCDAFSSSISLAEPRVLERQQQQKQHSFDFRRQNDLYRRINNVNNHNDSGMIPSEEGWVYQSSEILSQKSTSESSKLCNNNSNTNNNSKSQVSCLPRWKGLFVEASEADYQQRLNELGHRINCELEKLGIKSFMVHPPFSYSKYRSFMLISRFFNQCLKPLVDARPISKFIRTLQMSGLGFVAVFFFEHAHLHGFDPNQTPEEWTNYLNSSQFMRYCEDFEPGRRVSQTVNHILNCWDLREEVSAILQIKAVFLFDLAGKAFAEEIVQNRELFRKLVTNGRISLSMFIGDLYLLLNDMMHVPSSCSMQDLFDYIQQQHLERSLQEEVKRFLNLQEIVVSSKVATDEVRKCYQTMLQCDSRLQSAIQTLSAKFYIGARSEYQEACGDEWPIIIPASVGISELKDILGYRVSAESGE